MADIVNLLDVKTHLRYPDPSQPSPDDPAFQGFIDAADDVIKVECGDIVPARYVEFHDGGRRWIFLHHYPVLSVDNVEEGWGWANYELDYQQVNTQPAQDMFAYSLDLPAIGGVTRRTAGNVSIPFVPGDMNIKVNYTAGRSSVPGSVRLAALELISHWWTNSQFRSGGSASGTFGSYDTTDEQDVTGRQSGMTSPNVGVPFRVLELLKPYRHTPIFA
jgi:hypothetical protein